MPPLHYSHALSACTAAGACSEPAPPPRKQGAKPRLSQSFTTAPRVYNDTVIDFRLCWARVSLEPDLDALADAHPVHADFIDVIFDLLQQDRELRLAFTRTRFSRIAPSPRLDVAPVQWALKAGMNISYAKLWDDYGALVAWRLIFAVDESPASRRLLILAVMNRDIDYEEHSDFGKRLELDYTRFHFPRSGRQGH